MKLNEYKTVKAELVNYENMKGFIANLIIDNDPIAQEASDNIRFLKVMIKGIVTQRKKITVPMDEAKRAVMRQESEVIEPMKSDVDAISKKLTTYQIEKRHREEEEQRMLKRIEEDRLKKERDELIDQAEINQSELAMDDAIAKQQEINEVANVEIGGSGRVKETGGRSTSSLVDKFRFNVEDLSKVPPMYLIVNEKFVNLSINGKDRIKEIPGLKIWNDPFLSTRGR